MNPKMQKMFMMAIANDNDYEAVNALRKLKQAAENGGIDLKSLMLGSGETKSYSPDYSKIDEIKNRNEIAALKSLRDHLEKLNENHKMHIDTLEKRADHWQAHAETKLEALDDFEKLKEQHATLKRKLKQHAEYMKWLNNLTENEAFGFVQKAIQRRIDREAGR